MDDLCEKIDEVLVQFMDTLSELYKEQARLEEAMKAGYLNMSRARYNMGVRSVGIQQCDENKMNAHVKVIVEDNLFSLENVSDLESQFSDLDLGCDGDKSGLRKRTIQKVEDVSSFSTDKSSVQDIKLNDIKKAGPFDPIKWFGVLVPQALRQSQSEFKSSVEVAVSVANIKTKLVNLQREYTELLRKKKSMKE